jgi:hypothetical protein
MFRSSTILRKLVQSLNKVIFLSKHSVKLCRLLCGDVAACRETACVLFVVQINQYARQTAHTTFHDMLPHLHTIYKDIVLLNVLTEI